MTDRAPAFPPLIPQPLAVAPERGAFELGRRARIDVSDAAVPHREEGWNLLLPSVWSDPADTEKNIAWTKDTYAALSEHFAGRRWLNYLGDDQGDDAVRAAYGPNYDRLVEAKRKYDPDNVFHHNHNIKPEGA